jgi:EAL domain-containing protein (putative c-di-GMP-specific phosphodiesterase class I)
MEPDKPSSASESPLVDFGAVCRKVRAAMDSSRVHAVSLHDEKGEVLWLTESSMGPDEHNAVRDGFEAFTVKQRPIVVHDLGDSRSAVLFRAVGARRELVGAIMVVLERRGIPSDDAGLAKLMTPKLREVLSEFTDMRLAAGPAPAAIAVRPPAAAARSAASAAAPIARQPAGALRAPPRAAPIRPAPPADPSMNMSGSETISPEIDRLHAALRRSPIALHVQRLVPLAEGSQLRRYEVLLRSSSDDAPNAAPQAMLKAAVEHGLGSMIDRRVLTQLIGWLVHHPEVWRKRAVLFSVNLTKTALLDEHFIKFVGLCLAKSLLPQAMIAFEIDVQTAVQYGARVAEVAAALERLGCPLVLDDFGMRTECFDLLRLPAVRYVKLSSEITAKMRTDKLSQAAVTAVVQMARVLGMHTVAKRTETAAEQEWLTALGVDFIQSNALSPPIAIDSLLPAAKPKA